MKAFWRWWFGWLADYHRWRRDALQRRANSRYLSLGSHAYLRQDARWQRLQSRANVHYHMAGYCDCRVAELEEASNARN